MPHAFFLALAPGGMSASGRTTTSYHVLLPEECHEGIYDKGHYCPRFRKQTVSYARQGTKRMMAEARLTRVSLPYQLTDGCA
jgi:hypothetical protein